LGKNDKNVEKKGRQASEEKMPIFVKYGIIAVAVIVAIAIGLVILLNMDSTVAAINGEKITASEFKYQLEVQKQIMYSEAYSVDPTISAETFWATKIGGEDAVEVAKKKALDILKDTKVQYIKAKEAKITLTDQEKKSLDSYIQTNIIDVYGEGNKIKANKAFEAEYGFSIDVLRNAQIQNYIVQKYQYQEIAAISDADADVDKYYSSNPEWYKEDTQLRSGAEEAVWARHILVGKFDADTTQEEKDTAKKAAEELIAKLKAGEDFATLAKEKSEDPGSAERGGDYMFGKTASFYQEFKDAAFALQPGKFTETPVETGAGYHIIKVEEKYAEGEPVSLKCAQEYNEYGKDFVKVKLYEQKLAGWVKDASYKVNESVYESIR
jgi:foldase protein PrsA